MKQLTTERGARVSGFSTPCLTGGAPPVLRASALSNSGGGPCRKTATDHQVNRRRATKTLRRIGCGELGHSTCAPPQMWRSGSLTSTRIVQGLAPNAFEASAQGGFKFAADFGEQHLSRFADGDQSGGNLTPKNVGGCPGHPRSH